MLLTRTAEMISADDLMDYRILAEDKNFKFAWDHFFDILTIFNDFLEIH